MSDIEVIGLGALNIDHFYRVERILDDGEAVVEETASFPGGSAANTIYGLAKLGVRAGFAGVVSDDPEGKILLEDFQKAGADTSQIRVKNGAKTGSTLCLSDRLGRRSLYIIPGANNLLTMDDLNLTYLNQAKILHISSFADERQFKILLELLSKLEPSIKVSFSPGALYAIKDIKALSTILAKTYLLFANQDEIRQLTGEDVIAGAGSCLEQGCHIVVVTLGEGMRLEIDKGGSHREVAATCYIREAENEYVIEPPDQDMVSKIDATGAGDAFSAGFLYGLLKGKGLEECGHLGDIMARLSITKLGTRQGLPTFNQLDHRYQELYKEAL